MIYGDNPAKDNPRPDMNAIKQSGNLYAYCMDNPVNYVDRTGNIAEIISACLLIGALLISAAAVVSTPQFQATAAEATEAIASTANNVKKMVTTAPLKIADKLLMEQRTITVMGEETVGYKTFTGLKTKLDKKQGYEWHHIVERCQIWRSGFSPYVINSIINVVLIPHQIHILISSYYSRKPNKEYNTSAPTIRDWLTGKSFEFQYSFGIKVLMEFGVKV